MLLGLLLASSVAAAEGPGVVVGGGLGPAIALGSQSLGPTVHAELGLRPRLWQERLTVGLTTTWSAPAVEGVASHEDLEQDLAFRMRTHSLGLFTGLSVRLGRVGAPLSPELLAAPGLGLAWTRQTGTDPAFGPVSELLLRPTALVGAGLAGAVGPGELSGRIAGSWLPLDGALTAGARLVQVHITLGYRVVL